MSIYSKTAPLLLPGYAHIDMNLGNTNFYLIRSLIYNDLIANKGNVKLSEYSNGLMQSDSFNIILSIDYLKQFVNYGANIFDIRQRYFLNMGMCENNNTIRNLLKDLDQFGQLRLVELTTYNAIVISNPQVLSEFNINYSLDKTFHAGLNPKYTNIDGSQMTLLERKLNNLF